MVEDYKTSERVFTKDTSVETIQLPKSNVLKYILEDGSWFCLRPSGTEPKVKFYFGVNASTLEQSKQDLNNLTDAVMTKVNELIEASKVK